MYIILLFLSTVLSLCLDQENMCIILTSFNNNVIGWNCSRDACGWSGVICDHHIKDESVSIIDLRSPSSIEGTIASMANLTYLTAFSLGISQVSGTIPTFTSTLKFLSISNNHVSGTVPYIPSLVYLSLINIPVTGTLPTLEHLTTLHLEKLDITGELLSNVTDRLILIDLALTGEIHSVLDGEFICSNCGLHGCFTGNITSCNIIGMEYPCESSCVPSICSQTQVCTIFPDPFPVATIASVLGIFVAIIIAIIAHTCLSKSKQVLVKDKLIGEGTYAKVYHGYWGDMEVAIKEFKGAPTDEFIHEVKIMQGCDHPNILKLVTVCLDNNNMSIVTDYCANGSLHNFLKTNKKLRDDTLVVMALDCCRGMIYLHSIGIIHRDLKSYNLLVDSECVVKVADFGLSTLASDSGTAYTICGTPAWCAPEVNSGGGYTKKADVYSFGMVLYELFTKREPYSGMPPTLITLEVSKGAIPKLNIDDHIPTDIYKLYNRCIDRDPIARPDFIEIEKILKRHIGDMSEFYTDV